MIIFKGKLYDSYYCSHCKVERPTELVGEVIKCMICENEITREV